MGSLQIADCGFAAKEVPINWVCVQLDPGPAFLRAVASAMAERAANCNPQEISNTVWAYAKLSTFMTFKVFMERHIEMGL